MFLAAILKARRICAARHNFIRIILLWVNRQNEPEEEGGPEVYRNRAAEDKDFETDG
jgi:hypothetical protein